MTGFGRAEIDSRFGRFTVEVSSVNSRFLELAVRLPRNLTALEPQARELLNAGVTRGKVSLFVNLMDNGHALTGPLINRELARNYHRELLKLKRELKLEGDLRLSDILQIPEITHPVAAEPDQERIWPVIRKGILKALKAMQAMRAREGKAMAADMARRLKVMTGLIASVEKSTAGAVEKYAAKLAARIAELLNGQKYDPVRLEEEIAIFADRTDIAEECLRFRSHIDQFLQTMNQSEAVGRRLNFILQELNREVNTIGSKASEFDVSAKVISLKEEIEKLREQAQNVE
ncbi:MAG: YicC/YloC family endoribonuclease [Candidatus Zixiibacteriota bacterium]